MTKTDRRKMRRERKAQELIESKKSVHEIACKRCGQMIEVPGDVNEVLCANCTVLQDIKLFGMPIGVTKASKKAKSKRNNYPRGYHFMTEYVSEDGKVFHKGIEQPDLLNTLPATDMENRPARKRKNRKPKVKLTKNQKTEGFRAISVEIEALKKEIMTIEQSDSKRGLKKRTKIMARLQKKRKLYL